MRGKKHDVSFNKVKGHAEDPLNNRCDELARAPIREYRRMNGEQAEPEAPPPEKK